MFYFFGEEDRGTLKLGQSGFTAESKYLVQSTFQGFL
jgi:hypothetical protein